MTYLWFRVEAEGLHSDRSVWSSLQNPWGLAKDFLKSRNKELKRNSCPGRSCVPQEWGAFIQPHMERLPFVDCTRLWGYTAEQAFPAQA